MRLGRGRAWATGALGCLRLCRTAGLGHTGDWSPEIGREGGGARGLVFAVSCGNEGMSTEGTRRLTSPSVPCASPALTPTGDAWLPACPMALLLPTVQSWFGVTHIVYVARHPQKIMSQVPAHLRNEYPW